MLREKSNNTALTTWLKQRSTQSTSTSNSNENSMTEEEELQLAIQQSTAEYQAQQKHDYDLISKSKSKHSTILSGLPPLDDDDDDQWFQTVSPRRVKREKRPSLKHTSSKRKRNNTNGTPTPTQVSSSKTKTSTFKQQQQQQQQQQIQSPEKSAPVETNDTNASLQTIKDEEDDWEICDDLEQTQDNTVFTQVQSSKLDKLKNSIQHQNQPSDGSVMEPLSMVKENGAPISFGPVKEEEESWEICDDSQHRQQDDDNWEIRDNTGQIKEEEEESWEINDEDDPPGDDDDENDNENDANLVINNRDTPPVTRRSVRSNNSSDVVITSDTQQGDDLQQYVSAIRNRTTKTVILPSSTSANSQPKRPATQLDDVFNVFKNHRNTPTMRKPIDSSYNPPSIYQSSFDRHGTLTSRSVDTVEEYQPTSTRNNRKQSDHSSMLVKETAVFSGRPNSLTTLANQSDQQLQDGGLWDNDSDCSSIIDLCADDNNDVEDMVLVTSPDRASNGNEDLNNFFDGYADDELYGNNHLDTTYNDDDDSTFQNGMGHWATTMDDNDLIIVDNNTPNGRHTTTAALSSSSPPPPPPYLPTNTVGSRNSDTHHQIEDDDDGYLSPLEGFTSLLEQSHTSADYRPFFDQLTSSAQATSSFPSSRRAISSRRSGGSSSRTNTSRYSRRGRGRRGFSKKK